MTGYYFHLQEPSNLEPPSQSHDIIWVNSCLDLPHTIKVAPINTFHRGIENSVIGVKCCTHDVFLTFGQSYLVDLLCALLDGIVEEVVRNVKRPGVVQVQRKERDRSRGWVRGGFSVV